MEGNDFRDFARKMVDFIIDYQENIRDRTVIPDVQPGFLRPLMAPRAPEDPEDWTDVMKDVERLVLPGTTHWHSPRFHAFYPSANSYPAIVGDILSGAIGCIGFSWAASPACTELEVIMMDWLAKMLGLPEHFLSTNPSPGGGVIQGTSCDALLVALLAAKAKAVRLEKVKHPELSESEIAGRLVSYGSDQTHPSVERTGLLVGITVRLIPTDERFAMSTAALEEAIRQDRAAGRIPFHVVATIGTTIASACDNIEEVGLVAEREGLWMHVEASFAGAAFICPEFRHLLAGVERADSFTFNPHNWLLVNFDCSALWLKDPSDLEDMFNVDPLYLRHEQQKAKSDGAIDFRHWQVPLGRRFRALKLWFVLRLYGVDNLQAYIRNHVQLAKEFEKTLRDDNRFEIVAEVIFSTVCFRLKGPNELSRELYRRIRQRRVLFLMQAEERGSYFLRLTVCSRYATSEDMAFTWKEIREQTDLVLQNHDSKRDV